MALAVGASVATTGCARKAPGPEECHALALRWASTERGRLSHRYGDFVIEPTVDRVLERTNECLTTPYDRELVTCIVGGGSPKACYAGFLARTGSTDVPKLPLP